MKIYCFRSFNSFPSILTLLHGTAFAKYPKIACFICEYIEKNDIAMF